MTINIDGQGLIRVAAIAAATVGVGAAAFFGGQTTRMSDEARANERQDAVAAAVQKAEKQNAVEMAEMKQAAREHERKAVRKAKRSTRKLERKRAEQKAERARSEGYSAGNTAGYGAGHSAGYSDGESSGRTAGYEEGIDAASDDLTCSDDPDVALPYCN